MSTGEDTEDIGGIEAPGVVDLSGGGVIVEERGEDFFTVGIVRQGSVGDIEHMGNFLKGVACVEELFNGLTFSILWVCIACMGVIFRKEVGVRCMRGMQSALHRGYKGDFRFTRAKGVIFTWHSGLLSKGVILSLIFFRHMVEAVVEGVKLMDIDMDGTDGGIADMHPCVGVTAVGFFDDIVTQGFALYGLGKTMGAAVGAPEVMGLAEADIEVIAVDDIVYIFLDIAKLEHMVEVEDKGNDGMFGIDICFFMFGTAREPFEESVGVSPVLHKGGGEDSVVECVARIGVDMFGEGFDEVEVKGLFGEVEAQPSHIEVLEDGEEGVIALVFRHGDSTAAGEEGVIGGGVLA